MAERNSAKERKYEKPLIEKIRSVTFPLDILRTYAENNGNEYYVCKQCSSCHNCR
ncbi:MAG: hypothetical protein ABIF18_01425 [archaeon]